MTDQRQCSRPGCRRPAVATLTYAYAEQTAVVGPLAQEKDPHSWDLCEHHSSRITAPHGWEMVRVDHIELDEDDDDLLGLAELVGAGERVTENLGADGDPIEYSPTFDGADPQNSNHPVFRMRRVADVRAARRSHLSVVPDEASVDGEDPQD
ncbi:DUF3499 domain-containing protein [Corynebacterium lizhenjunii]|uniref:DUF3499 domain-containing protein n=1 Tax=Corynebacterium lizhenjunii TaxID=2709394 RepID=UPI0013EB9C19|nr:DUF3499 domain-containing protein [Corynebacterium lizhenjunii]